MRVMPRCVRVCHWGLASWLLLSPLGAGAETGWAGSTAALEAFLASAHVSEALLIRRCAVLQAGRPLPLYDPIGREDRNRNLRRRLILAPAQAEGPFVRGTEFVARVNRSFGISVRLDLAVIAKTEAGLAVQPAAQARIRLRPGEGWKSSPLDQGALQLEIPPNPPCGEVDIEVRSGAERHRLTLRFLNEKSPVTLAPRL
jgi:hypothetical protein